MPRVMLKEMAVAKVTTLTEPQDAAIAPEFATLKRL
jgi:hypothetical protein